MYNDKNTQKEIMELKTRIENLEQRDSFYNQQLNTFISLQNVLDFVEVVSAVPTQTPQKLYDQIKFYVSGATYRLYIYDYTTNAWRYVALT